MYFNRNQNAGLPYNDINWSDINGQPFGVASNFNAIIFGNANNIVDTKGAMAVGGNFTSSRGLTLGYGNDLNLTGTGYSPDLVRFLVGGNVAMQGPLVVIGHVLAGGEFKAARGSTYMIGKDGSPEQARVLMDLYSAPGGSRYWSLGDRGTHYAVSSYDVPRFIPAARVNANVRGFFSDAKESITNFFECITGLQPNGTVTERYHEWILRGSDPRQNVFLIDARPNGILNKEIRFEIPQGSLAIVIFRTGNNAHIQYGLWGDKSHANNTLYVFEDASNIHMEVPAAIWGSILAPQVTFNAHPTGGTVNGNAALGALNVNATSGFEFHLFPFVGGVVCRAKEQAPAPRPRPTPIPRPIPRPRPTPIPRATPVPTPVQQPEQVVIPTPVECPECPQPVPCPQPAPCPLPAPCPSCPEQQPCPEAKPCPQPAPCPSCPEAKPCPQPAPCPSCPEQQPCPEAKPCPSCPQPAPCPPCPPAQPSLIKIQPVPIPIPMPCPEQEKCEECLVTPGVIYGCIWGCSCCHDHEWEIKLYRNCGDRRTLLYCIRICNCGCFNFEVPYDDFYLLVICPVHKSNRRSRYREECKPKVTLKNIGVANLMIEK